MIKRFHFCVHSNKNFAFETTAAGRTYRKHLKNAKDNGYEINLLFLWLSSHDQAVKRVAQRVKQGGHNIPEDVIIRRYYRGLCNLINLYLPLADTAFILDNSESESGERKTIARKDFGQDLIVEDTEIWEKIRRDKDVKT